MSSRLSLLFTAIKELGLEQLALYALYQAGLRSGWWRLLTKSSPETGQYAFEPLMTAPADEQLRTVIGDVGAIRLLEEAELLVVDGKYAMFGAEAQLFNLAPMGKTPLKHWTAYERGAFNLPVQDIKFLWEPARMGWAFLLLRAYKLTCDTRYRDAFWEKLTFFLEHNPPMMGPNWSSGQETAIRVMVMAWVGGIFLQNDPDAGNHALLLSRSVCEHAQRIPPTLLYARSQHNNHLITEALGLVCAGLAVPSHPEAGHWMKLGLRWLNHAFETQIAGIGEYAQHSMNYHRLMLQCACLASVLLKNAGYGLTDAAMANLKTAAVWLATEVDGSTGQAANYGNNDGAYLFPVDSGGFGDFRMAAQAGARIFTGKPLYPSGHWDEFSLWLGLDIRFNPLQEALFPKPDELLKLGTPDSWARMRANYFTSRPAHADQLHVDLWWKGRPIALDAGTYLYNGAAPWNNQLMGTTFHNTVMVDGEDQMRRAGQFLWLKWAQACAMRPESAGNFLQAEHNGYRQKHIIHRRTLERIANQGWLVKDTLFHSYQIIGEINHSYRIQWLLPDGEWSLDQTCLRVSIPQGVFRLTVSNDQGLAPALIQVCRAGQVIFGEGTCAPQTGWQSQIYGEKKPAISFSVTYEGHVPQVILSEWKFSE